jgi:hypothetical protein
MYPNRTLLCRWLVPQDHVTEGSGASLVLPAIVAAGISAKAGGAMPRQRTLAAIFRAIVGGTWRDGTSSQAVQAQREHPVRSPGTNTNRD